MKFVLNIHRRRFLAGCVLIVGAGAVPLLRVGSLAGIDGIVSRSVRNRKLSLAMLTKSDFEPCVGTTFTMEIDTGMNVPVELIEVVGFSERSRREGATREPFSLVFRGERGLQVNQQIFKLNHPEIGSQELFLVPLGPDEKGMRLEAVFS